MLSVHRFYPSCFLFRYNGIEIDMTFTQLNVDQVNIAAALSNNLKYKLKRIELNQIFFFEFNFYDKNLSIFQGAAIWRGSSSARSFQPHKFGSQMPSKSQRIQVGSINPLEYIKSKRPRFPYSVCKCSGCFSFRKSFKQGHFFEVVVLNDSSSVCNPKSVFRYENNKINLNKIILSHSSL